MAAARRGRRHRPRRPVRQRRPHLARSTRSRARIRFASACTSDGVALTERLCVYPQYIDREWVDQSVLDTIRQRYWSFIPRPVTGGSARTDPPRADPPRPRRRRDRARPRRRGAQRGRADRAVRRDASGGDRRACARRPTSCAPRSRARPSPSSSTATSTSPTSAPSAAPSAASARASARPDAYEHDEDEFRAPRRRGRRLRRDRAVHPVRHPPRLGPRRLPALAARRQGRGGRADDLHLHAYSPMEIAHMCDISGPAADEVFARLRDAGPRLHARHRGRGPARRRARADQPEQAAGRALGRDHRGQPPRRPALDVDGDVRAHRGAVGARRAHARVRELQERTGGITEFVPLSFIPFHTLLGRTHGIEEITREENLKHTAVFRLALGRTIAQRAGELGQDGPRRRHRGALAGASTTSAAR